MALYVKVFTSFFACKKTIRLRAKLGDDALWIPIRLWAYAAEHEPDGDLSDYSAEEIALLIGYNKDATSMLQALQDVGFLDGKIIHHWAQYNAYHQTFSERGKTAADARWAKHNAKKASGTDTKKRKEKSRVEKSRVEPSIATGMLGASLVPTSLRLMEGFDTEWEQFVLARKKLKKPMTDHAQTLILNRLAKYPGSAAMEILQLCMERGWQSFQEDWPQVQEIIIRCRPTLFDQPPKEIQRIDEEHLQAWLTDNYPGHAGNTAEQLNARVFAEYLKFRDAVPQ